MGRRVWWGVVVLAVATFTAQAGPVPPVPPTLNATMARIGGVMQQLFPLIVVRRDLDDAELTQVKADLAQMLKLFHAVEPQINAKSETYQVSYQLILEHLDDTRRAFDEERIDDGRKGLYALGPICTSCHTQDTRLRTLFAGSARAAFASDLDYAEFNYLTRNYADAELYYDKYLHSAEPKTEFDIIRPLQHLIVIYTQIRNRPGHGAERLKGYLGLPGNTEHSRQQIRSWIAGLEALDASGVSRVQAVDFTTLQGFVTRYLGTMEQPKAELHLPPQEEVARVWLRGLLYHYLNSNPPREQMPRLYYWLAVTDRSINYDYYYSLSELYLVECITGHAEHPYAGRCYDEYESYMLHLYSGPAGEFLPPEVKEELDMLRSHLQQKLH